MAVFQIQLSFALLPFFLLVVSPISGLRHERALDLIRDPRIVNGVRVQDQEEYPFFVRLRVAGKANKLHCGGSLIGPDVVLSAAHCYRDDLVVGINAYYLNKDNVADSSEIERSVRSIVRHPDYDSTTFEHDFMLIFLDEEVQGVPPIKLNQNLDIPKTGAEVKSVGLGSTSALYYAPADYLQEVSLTTLSNDFCNHYQRYGGLVVDPIMFCAGFHQSHNTRPRDSCYGDSGGPLLYYDETSNVYIQAGVVSWGVGCAEQNYPGVYANVAAEYDWIERISCDYSNSSSGGHLQCHEDIYRDKVPTQSQTESFTQVQDTLNSHGSRSRRRNIPTNSGTSADRQNRFRSGRNNSNSSDKKEQSHLIN